MDTRNRHGFDESPEEELMDLLGCHRSEPHLSSSRNIGMRSLQLRMSFLYGLNANARSHGQLRNLSAHTRGDEFPFRARPGRRMKRKHKAVA